MGLLSNVGNIVLKVHDVIARVLNPFGIRGISLKIILPWNEGFFIYPVDYGHDKGTNIYFLTWGCFHFRIIMPFPLPKAAKVPVTTVAPTPETPAVEQK